MLKNENELLVHLINATQNMQKHLKELNKAIENIQEEKRKQQKRTYRCRVRKDLQNKFLEVVK
ncbi:hypothetical protein [Virgibacillus salexigens]|uniref:Uncharacterized protein n=1 Tax=Virgibacillus kapii TaxID=1638645 RepID=A0ABQ2D7Y4_9BACI|nr:hypothetical protein [Virgibacillus kapii]GGJ48839.1 hypothetical protein GCM10007111_08550 [Virgibacillus kapii]